MSPPWIEADKEARSWLDRRDALLATARTSTPAMRRTLERDLTSAVNRYNAAVERVNAGRPRPGSTARASLLGNELEALHRAIDDRRDGH